MGHRRGTHAAVATLLAILFAGCSKASGEAGLPAPQEPVAVPTAEVSDALGGVQGSVVDNSVFPIAEANVSIEHASSAGEPLAVSPTAIDGSFAFSLLEPGAYRVTATHPNFGGGSALAHINAGTISRVTVILADVAGDAPYFLLFIETGFMPCAVSVVAWADTCDPIGVVGDQVNRFIYNISAGHSYVVVQTDWQPRTVTMDHDFWAREQVAEGEENNAWDAVGRGFGQPILRVDFWPEKPYIRALDAATEAPTLFPSTDQDIQFRVDTWYDGQYQSEINGAGGAACSYMLLGYCTGVGLQLEHRFQQYTTVFMNGQPENVEDYSAVPDQ